jgi:hypothetical protein
MRSSIALYGRLVLNHSTFVDDLLPILKRLSSAKALQSIIPGRISSAKKSKNPNLEIKLSEHINNNKSNSIRLIARKGTQLQEIYILYDTNIIDSINNTDIKIEQKVLSYIRTYLNDDNITIRESNEDKNQNDNNNNNNDNNEKKATTLYSDKYLKFL